MSVIKNDQLFSEQSLLSPDAGNLLEARNNGLYCGNGNVASNAVKEIYVDLEEGNDGNPGTKERPFQTLVNALKSLTSAGEYVFHLKDNQRHQLDANESIVVPGGSITFQPYSASSDKPKYDMNVIIDFKPKGLIDDSINHDGSLLALDWSVLSITGQNFFLFRNIKIHLHEHLHLSKTKTESNKYHNELFYQSAFRKQHFSASISITLVSCDIHFQYQERNWGARITGGFISGAIWQAFPDTISFYHMKAMSGYGDVVIQPNTSLFIKCGNHSQNIFENEPDLWNKYFGSIQVDHRGNLNCQLDVNLRRYVKNY